MGKRQSDEDIALAPCFSPRPDYELSKVRTTT